MNSHGMYVEASGVFLFFIAAFSMMESRMLVGSPSLASAAGIPMLFNLKSVGIRNAVADFDADTLSPEPLNEKNSTPLRGNG